MSEQYNEVFGGQGSGGSGGAILQWDPVLEPNKVVSGKRGGGTFIIVNNSTITNIDNVPAGTTKNTIIYFNEEIEKWEICSASDSQQVYKGTFATPVILESTYPAANENIGSTADVLSTGTKWFVNTSYVWVDSGSSDDLSSLKIANFLSEFNTATAKSTAAENINVYQKDAVNTLLNLKQNTSEKGQVNGYASLDGTGKVPASQLPSFVDDVLEYADVASFPATGVTGTIYVALDTNLTYRWSGSVYVKLNDVDLTNYFNKTSETTDNITEGTKKFTTQADIDKLAGIEAGATANQTDAEIKTAYENNANTNAFTDAEQTKLAGIEANATADQTAAEIKTAYETNLDTNAFTDSEKAKLAGIATGAEVNVQANLSQTDNLQDDYVIGKSTANIADSTDKRYITDAQQTVLVNTSGINTGDETTLSIQTKRPLKTIKNQSLEGSGNIDVTKSDLGLGDVDNTSDADKPISTAQQTALNAKEDVANKGVANGYASLDGAAKVPASQLPSYVDDVVEYANFSSFPATGETGKVYVALDTNLTYRWSGSAYVKLNDVDLTDYFNKTVDTLDDVNAGITNKHFTATLETKLNGIEAGATANSTDATLLNRANHTGTQTLSTISDAGTLASKNTIATGDVDNNAITTAKIQQFASKTVVGRTSAGTGDVEEIAIATTLKADLNLTSADLGLGNVDNTSDADKPISTAQQTVLDGKLAKASNLSDVANRQVALDNLTDAANATNEEVLTKDTATGNVIFKPIPSLQALLPTGSIVMSIANSISGTLKFDGVSSYSKTIYSTLYSILSSEVGNAFDLDANNFYLPDPSGRVVGVAGAGRALFNLIGSDTHTLTIDEMPTHTHGNNSSSNDGGYGLINISSGGNNTTDGALDSTPGEPNLLSRPQPLVSYNTGGGLPHNITQKTFYGAKNLFIYY